MTLRLLATACALTIVAAASTIAIARTTAPAPAPTVNISEVRDMANALFSPIPETAESPRGETLTAEQIELGKALYFDPRLSRSQIISCNTCHNLGTGGVDNLPKSFGHAWQKGGRNSPTVLNSVFNATQFWDGRAPDLKEQAKGPLENPVEMDSTAELVETTLRSIPGYMPIFQSAFPGQKQPITFDNAARAIEAFETTLITPNAPFDKFLNGDDTAMSSGELQGLSLFMEKGCITCHTGVNLGGQNFFPFGLVNAPDVKYRPLDDRGLADLNGDDDQEYFFRVPTLRNITLTAPYFHSGQTWNLTEAVDVMSNAQLGLELTQAEINSITSFLGTLTGDQPRVEYPILPPSGDSTPRGE